MKRKSLVILAICLTLVLVFATSCSATPAANSQAASAPAAAAPAAAAGADSAKGEYYMVSFYAGADYFKGSFAGFKAAADALGVTAIYMGSPGTDMNAEVTVLDQVIAKNPKGIAVSCVNPDGMKASIQKAIAQGIPVVTFDADSPDSGRYCFLGTSNYNAGAVAAKALGQLLNGTGSVGVLQVPGLLNLQERVQGFEDTLASTYPNIKVVQTVNGNLDETTGAKVTSAMIQAHPDIVGIFGSDASAGVGAATAVKEAGKAGEIKIVAFDTDTGTLDLIKAGVISGSIAQGVYNMGWWSFSMLYDINGGSGNFNPVEGWKELKLNPLPQNVDTGAVVVTKDNVDAFYTKK